MTIELPERLPDDLEEIAAAIPPVPRGLGALRQTLALLPWPPMATTQGSFPADEVLAPEAAAAAAGLGTQPGPGTIGPGGILEGAVGVGQLRDGAVTGAAFASTIRPVYLVNSLPTLPDAAYPVDSFVFNLGETPHRLYKNEANVWVKLIGPNDIQADSITAGQLAAGAVSTSELAVGARLTGEVANETGLTPGVFIDSTGILIRSGKLVLQDEFGLTAMQASGFSGTWLDFLGAGLYNAAFTAGALVALALGRTANLPYWTVARDDVGTGTPDFANDGGAVLTRAADSNMPGGFRVRCTFSGLNDNAYLISDRIPVVAGSTYFCRYTAGFNRTAGIVGLTPFFRWLDQSGAQISLVQQVSVNFNATTAPDEYVTTNTLGGGSVMRAPAGARFVQVIMQAWESTTHDAANSVDFGAVAFARALDTLEVNPDARIALEALQAEEHWGGTSGATFKNIGSTGFPSSPANGDVFFRSDRRMWFRYDGARWLCTCSHEVAVSPALDDVLPLTATATAAARAAAPDPALVGASDVWLEKIALAFFVSGGTALSGSHKWVGDVTSATTAGGATARGTLTIASGASNVWRRLAAVTVNALLGTDPEFEIDWTKTGTPGALYHFAVISYRYVG